MRLAFSRVSRALAVGAGEGALVASMDLRELAQEVGPRLRKSHPNTAKAARNFVAAKLWLQERQLIASAAARLCDQPDGPTAIGYGE